MNKYMQVFIFEVKKILPSLLIWIASIFVLHLFFMAFFPTFSKEAATLDRILAFYPPELLKAFGLGEASSLADLLGYYGFVFPFVQLCLGVQSAYYGFHLLSVEEREMTADFLLSKPVSRKNIWLSKVTTGYFSMLTTAFFTCLGGLIALKFFSSGQSYDTHLFVRAYLWIPVFQTSFFSFGLFISCLLSKIRSVLGYTMGIVFATYVLNAFRSIIGSQHIALLSPFYHLDFTYLVRNNQFNLSLILPASFVSFILLYGSYRLFLMRNMRTL